MKVPDAFGNIPGHIEKAATQVLSKVIKQKNIQTRATARWVLPTNANNR